MVSFGQHHIKGLQVQLPPQLQSLSTENQALHALLLAKSLPSVRDVVPLLDETDVERDGALVDAITARLVVNVYADALDTLMREAGIVEAEAEWWANVERSKANVAWYLLQTLPERISDLFGYVIFAVRTRNVTASSLFFPTHSSFRAAPALVSLFPHLDHRKALINLFEISPIRILAEARSSSPDLHHVVSSVWTSLVKVYRFFTIPLRLAQQECQFKRLQLRKLRNQRAQSLGALAQRRTHLELALKCSGFELREKLSSFLVDLNDDISFVGASQSTTTSPPLPLLNEIVTVSFPAHKVSHTGALQSASLLRPSRLTRIWPKLILLPPIALLAARAFYNRRSNIFELYRDAKETTEGFFRGWVLDPINDILRTVRAGGEGEGGIIIRAEGVKADMDSLERMAISLAQDELGYSSAQLEALRSRIAMGDLTPVLEIYEKDIKNPVKSALFGTLIRSVFVQIQKTKVDVDQALTGIDKLIKSQELTFAFVGVAPALAVVYVLGGYLRRVFVGSVLRATGTTGYARYGGRQRREGIWLVMRRIERLITSSSASDCHLSSLTQGLLLLSLNQLREYAYVYLPTQTGFQLRDDPVEASLDDEESVSTPRNSATGVGEFFDSGTAGLREGFLEDVTDLEDPNTCKADKLRVLERMWRCWGSALGWHTQGD